MAGITPMNPFWNPFFVFMVGSLQWDLRGVEGASTVSYAQRPLRDHDLSLHISIS